MPVGRTSGKSARKPHDGFDVEGLREQVGEVHLLNLVAGIEQHAQVACEGCRIAGDVCDMAGFDRRQALSDSLAETGTRGIDQNEVWLGTLSLAIQERFRGRLD